jgi:hypothetical protein
MPGVQLAALAAHSAPSGNGTIDGQWLAVSDAVDLEQGVAAEHEPIAGDPARDVLRLGLGEAVDLGAHRALVVCGLVDRADHDLRFHAGRPQRRQPGR